MSIIEQTLLIGLTVYAFAGTIFFLVLDLLALDALKNYLHRSPRRDSETHFSGVEPPISVIVPAYNEGATIVASLQSILQLDYPEMEVLVVNDGSKDNTLEVLINSFDFEPFPEAQRLSIDCKPIRQVYLSRRVPHLRLLDKENGGKADAINAGINLSRNPLFCCIDADSVLEPDSLAKVVQPFVTNRNMIATGGTVRVANGCDIKRGYVTRRDLPTNWVAMFQFMEYIRGFLFGRLGWSRINGLMIISGAFGVFRKNEVVKAGGYATGTIGEDMELILRMYRELARNGRPHAVEFVPDPVCWTEAPETLKVLGMQRKRWHRGLSESLQANQSLLFGKHTGTVGWLAYPFFVVFEWLSPFVELAGYLLIAYLLIVQKITFPEGILLLIFALLLAMIISTTAIVLDELLFRGSIKWRGVAKLMLTSVLECFGYRQLNMIYKLQGAIGWLMKERSSWGEMTRVGFSKAD